MTGKRRAALGGRWLDEVDERIICQGVETGSASENITTVTLSGGAGSRVTNRHRNTLPVTVKFSIRAKRGELGARSALYEAVMDWAGKAMYGAWLTVNYKENRRIWVRLSEVPAEEDFWDWTKTYAIKFTAYGVPYWQETSTAESVTGTGTSGSTGLQVGGNARTVADVVLENRSGANIATATININGQTMSFSNLDLGGGQSLVIGHDEEGLLYMRIGGRSVMNRRTDGSANDFYVDGGTAVGCSFSAQRACVMRVSAKGRFL